MWNNLLRRLRFTLFVLLISCSAFARKADTRHFPLEQINVTGSQRYTEQAIVAATGLRVGQQASQEQLEKVSEKLGSSGLFSLVQFRFGWGTKGVVATFSVTDSTKLVPVGFENLVWFSSNELTTAIKKKLPLFTGVVPLAGDYRDQVAAALNEVLAEHNLHGSVTVLPQGAAGQITAMLFRVEGHEIKVTSCEFSGTDHGNQLELHELAKYIMAMSYDKSFVEQSIETRLKDSYEALGYLAERSQRPELKLISSSPDRTEIALTTKVVEGQQYRVGSLSWSGNTLFTQAQLEKTINFPTGQVASIPSLRRALYSARKRYQGIGYLGANLEFEPKLFPDGTAQFNITVVEGSQYTMGSLKFVGIDQSIATQASAAWQMKTGSPYDPSYPINFMSQYKFFPNGRCDCRNREVINDDNRTVDVQIEVQLKQ